MCKLSIQFNSPSSHQLTVTLLWNKESGATPVPQYCHYTTMDPCFNFLGKKCFHRLSLTGIFGFTFFGAIIWSVLLYHEVSESEKFRCYEVDKKTSDATRDVCYDDYNKQFNRNFPLYAFTLLLLFLVLGVCVVYSQYVRPQVENEINSTECSPVITYKVFTVYSGHLIIKSILMTVALVLQWGVIYPISFPATFSCHSGRTKNNSTENPVNIVSTTTISADYHCKNPPARIKTIFAIVLFATTALFLGLSLVELIHLLPKAKTENFTNNQNFCRKCLNCIDSTGEEQVDAQPLLINMENASFTQRTRAFHEGLCQRIKNRTEEIRSPIPTKLSDLSNGVSEKRNLDEVFVNVSIHRGIAKQEFRQIDERRLKSLAHIILMKVKHSIN